MLDYIIEMGLWAVIYFCLIAGMGIVIGTLTHIAH